MYWSNPVRPMPSKGFEEMIAQLKNAFAKACCNPRHLWYFWRNVNVLRDHFPVLYRNIKLRKHLNLGSVADLARLHVIIRTTDCVMNLNASRRLEDFGIKTKSDVIGAGGCSVFPAAAKFAAIHGRENIRITLVVDRLSEVGVSQYREAAESAGMDFDVVSAKGHGNAPTFQTQIDVALQDADDTLILVLEDDYKLEESVFTTCFEVMQSHSKVIGMNPHFHPDRVRWQDVGRIAAVGGKLYCQIKSTCCTFFMPVRAMRRFEKYLRLYDGWEKGSVSVAWERGLCLAPIGWTMAEHLHRSDLSPFCEFSTMKNKNKG